MDNQELFMESFKLLLGLEKLGIRIEDTKEDIECPNCRRTLDVAGGLRYLENDKRWF